jgi:dTDP-L-rhamnose 4-epimerase
MDSRNVYADTKLAQERLSASWARTTGATVTTLRYHNVYGPRMPRDTPYAGVAAIFRSALRRGEAPKVFEDGLQRRDFVHVRDVARANVLALARTGAWQAYNVASGEPHTVGEMATALTIALRGPDPVVTGDYRLGDVRHVVASPRKAHQELGFTAAVAFEDGMAEFAADATHRSGTHQSRPGRICPPRSERSALQPVRPDLLGADHLDPDIGGRASAK